jgi:rhodanese-related sulfurtransferase
MSQIPRNLLHFISMQIEADELKSRLDREEEIVLVDVRSAQEKNGAETVIGAAIAWDFQGSQTPPAVLRQAAARSSLVVVYCHRGDGASVEACQKLSKLGLNARQLAGGYRAWKNSGYPTRHQTRKGV